MYEKLKALLKKYRSIIIYLVFGGLTTAVNYAVSFPLHYLAGMPAAVCDIIAWVVAVTFAFITNKLFVFESKSWDGGVVKEAVRFVGGRVTSLLIEAGTTFLTVDILGWNYVVVKLCLAVFTIVFNYIFSKFFVFKK